VNRAALAAAFLVASVAGAAPAAPARRAMPYPSSMAAIGDSFTMGLCTRSQCEVRPGDSWSTGTNPAVQSQYLRILAANPSIRGRNYNVAVQLGSDAPTMVDLQYQLLGAVAKHVDYVTIELGASDLCEGTQPATFRSELDDGLARLTSLLPDVRVFVASINDATTEWHVLRGRAGEHLGCGIGPKASAARLASYRGRIATFNTQLSEACAAHPNCRYDGGAAFRIHWKLGDITPHSHGHLSISGQRRLAAGTWAMTFAFRLRQARRGRPAPEH
jgi:lysophospholipase L1-like esterase